MSKNEKLLCDCCDCCRYLVYDPPVKAGDVCRAVCTDPKKPVRGKNRVVAVSSAGKPQRITRPVWCRSGKEGKA